MNKINPKLNIDDDFDPEVIFNRRKARVKARI